MGGKSGGGTTDPYELMDAAARYNRIDQNTPTGSVRFSGPDRNIANVELSPEQQALFEGQQELTGTALDQMLSTFGNKSPGLGGGMFGGAVNEMSDLASVIGGLPTGGLDLASLPEMPGIGDFGLERDKMEKASFDRMMRLTNPMFDRREEREGQSLANRGIPEISELADTISGRRGRDYGEAVDVARNSAVKAGGDEQFRLFNMAKSARGQGLQEMISNVGTMQRTRDQLFREIMGSFGAGREMDAEGFNRLAALLGMSQINTPGAGMAGFWQPGQVDPNAANNSAQNAWAQQQEYSMGNQMMDLAGTLGGAALGSMTLPSSIAIKTDFESVDPDEILAALDGLDIPSWRYKRDVSRHIGPVAEEFGQAFGLDVPQEGGINCISAIDAVGVALAAIKALSARVKELEGR